nr:Asp23/Gls24 family envelope stress response protein [Streptomyces sulfonofaciens]
MNGRQVPPDGTGDDEALPCGTPLRAVWEAYDAGTAAQDPHLGTCPHCTAALHELTVLDGFVERARSADRSPAVDPDPFTTRVMELVRLEVRSGPALPLGGAEEDLWIVEAAVAKAFRAAVDALPGVRAGSCRVRPADSGAEAGGGSVRVDLEVVTSLERNLQEVAEAVRHRVVDSAHRALGLEVDAVDVTVADVLDDSGQAHGTTFSYAAAPGTGTAPGHGSGGRFGGPGTGGGPVPEGGTGR